MECHFKITISEIDQKLNVDLPNERYIPYIVINDIGKCNYGATTKVKT